MTLWSAEVSEENCIVRVHPEEDVQEKWPALTANTVGWLTFLFAVGAYMCLAH